MSESDDSLFSPASSQSADSLNPSPPTLRRPLSNGRNSYETEQEVQEESCRAHFQNKEDEVRQTGQGESAVFEAGSSVNGDGDAARGNERARDKVVGESGACRKAEGHKTETRHPPPLTFDGLEESPLIPMTLYMHRVNGLVLALLVQPRFTSDSESMKEVVRKTILSCFGCGGI